MYINDGTYKDVQILKPATVQWMKEKYGVAPLKNGYQISNANFIYTSGDKYGIDNDVLGHGGKEVGVATKAFFNPATNVGVIAFTNMGVDPNVLDPIIKRLFEDLPADGGRKLTTSGVGGSILDKQQLVDEQATLRYVQSQQFEKDGNCESCLKIPVCKKKNGDLHSP